MRDFKKYDVWQDSMKLVKEIYQLTRSFPIQEQYGFWGYGEETVVETLIKNIETIQKQLNLLIKNLNQK